MAGRDGSGARDSDAWAGPDSALGSFIKQESENTLDAYGSQPNLVVEHANLETEAAQGGYAHRQLFELIQNGADSLAKKGGGGRLSICLTYDRLYCADDGAPIDEDGATALLHSHLSPKHRANEIGRFGVGFKSVLRVTDSPEFFARSGSLRFSRHRSLERIRKVAPNAPECPVLRVADPIDVNESARDDPILSELMEWAQNIVRLPLFPEKHPELEDQISEFPAEFLLFVGDVHELRIESRMSDLVRTISLEQIGDEYRLAEGDETSSWRLFKRIHSLSSDARADWGTPGDGSEVPISWAAPLENRDLLRRFWAFFPTETPSLLEGILNAPWKTNTDRQNLLDGRYNKELIIAAAAMVAESLSALVTESDPARHLDVLPRRHAADDHELADLLRTELHEALRDRETVPDQDGTLRRPAELSYAPETLTSDATARKALEQWASYPDRPKNWVHLKALTRNRLAAIDRLFPPRWQGDTHQKAPRESIEQWLTALVKSAKESSSEAEAVAASMAAIQTAACIPAKHRTDTQDVVVLPEVVLTAAGAWEKPDSERVFLHTAEDGDDPEPHSSVHPALLNDVPTHEALEELGIGPRSPESAFVAIAARTLGVEGESFPAQWDEFWRRVRALELEDALPRVREHTHWRERLRVRTAAGSWQPIHSVLLPGPIVPDDGSRDADVAVDVGYHEPDMPLLDSCGVTDQPRDQRDLSSEPWFVPYLHECLTQTQAKAPGNPRRGRLGFASTLGAGPAHVLGALSDEGKARYTWQLLLLNGTYAPWSMRHDRHGYDTNYAWEVPHESPVLEYTRKHGLVRTSAGHVPLTDALGENPTSPDAQRALIQHPQVDRIKDAFGLREPFPQFVDEETPVPLTDEWPGLYHHLDPGRRGLRLIRCEAILLGHRRLPCHLHADEVRLTRVGDEIDLRALVEELSLELSATEFDAVLHYRTDAEIAAARAEVKSHSSDAERLFAAVGESALRSRLPASLVDILQADTKGFSGTQVADAAIATYHTDALREHRGDLDHLAPPKQWAGSRRAIEFVQSLGFSPEWAGEPTRRREPSLVVHAPYPLLPLHDFQKTVASNLRAMLRGDDSDGASRRGMISMPTGSGKTRVTVQAVVDAIREDGWSGDVLWVADRDELCEQAVEAWREVWASCGPHRTRLQISRMWGSQPPPRPTHDSHVVIGTIQTLRSKFDVQDPNYDFLKEAKLVVFDEAHRSLAPTYTSAMREIGLTHRQEVDEPLLLGLTATPYRGNLDETRWLVNRYDGNRLDHGAFSSDDGAEVVKELQSMRVLAEADHGTIAGGSFELHSWEAREAKSSPWLPRTAQDRIGDDAARTQRIVEACQEQTGPDWPVLIFATSVEHSQTVAALLNRKGIRARAVWSETRPSARRRIVEEFRSGEIRALVNYGVFREGFDAPKTRAIIVARPVFSPNLYFQMIGRGLRGPLNGGDERCLILDVDDNITNFQRALAFTELDWLWAGRS